MTSREARRTARLAVAIARELQGNVERGQGEGMLLDNWLAFSPTEERVILYLIDKGPQSRDTIAAALEESPDGRIKGVMATLVARHIVAVTTDGYRMNGTDAALMVLKGKLKGVQAVG